MYPYVSLIVCKCMCVHVRVLQNVTIGDIAVSFFTFLILYNNLVPISLYVSLDMIKVNTGEGVCVGGICG